MKITHMAAGLALAFAPFAASAQAEVNSASAAADEADFDREAWLADYAALKDTIARGYANLDWIVAHRGLDLAELDRRITADLEAARGTRDAVAAITAFAEAFGDNHLHGAHGPAPAEALRNANARDTGEPVEGAAGGEEPLSRSCEELGYRDGPRIGMFDPVRLPGWSRAGSAWFTAGVSGKVGLIRIPSFAESDYLPACEASWQPGRTARETQLATRALLQEELTRLAASLGQSAAGVLALDLTGNGGGSEWSEEAATLFTSRELTRPAPRLVETHCDRSGIWRGEKVCSNLAPAGEIDRREGTGAWDGPVAVLVGRHSASAAEDFAYWLSGSGVAKLVGERTFGAGCGYMDGGWAYQFNAIDGHVMIPNCSRYTAEGVNQVEGLEPDVAFHWEGDVAGLPELLEQSGN